MLYFANVRKHNCNNYAALVGNYWRLHFLPDGNCLCGCNHHGDLGFALFALFDDGFHAEKRKGILGNEQARKEAGRVQPWGHLHVCIVLHSCISRSIFAGSDTFVTLPESSDAAIIARSKK